MVRDPKMGDMFVIDGMERPVPMGLLAAAGKSAKELAVGGVKFEDMHRGGWDPDARMADQERDGVAAEVIYPTVGMLLCNHPDFDYKKACFDAYNLWIAEYCSAHPDRLIGTGQTAMRSVEEGIADLRKIKELGLKGVMMPGNPALADYHDPIYDPFYQASIDLELPLSFHILTSKADSFTARGPRLNNFLGIINSFRTQKAGFVAGKLPRPKPAIRAALSSKKELYIPLCSALGGCTTRYVVPPLAHTSSRMSLPSGAA